MQIVTKNDLLEAVQGKAIHCYVSRLTFDISCIMPEVTIGVGDELLCENENLYIEWEHVNKITKETQTNIYSIFLRDDTLIQIEII